MIATPPTSATRSRRKRRQACSQKPRALMAVGSPVPSPPPTAISAAPAVAPERIGGLLLVAIWLDDTPNVRTCPVTRHAEGTAGGVTGAAEKTNPGAPTRLLPLQQITPLG